MDEISSLKLKPLWQMTGEEFLVLTKNSFPQTDSQMSVVEQPKKYVYGLSGIARLFGCSIPTANRIKKSGRIDKAIKQVGRKIIVDADLALELISQKTGGRNNERKR